MGVKMGTVTGSSITTNKNGVFPVIMLQVMITSPEDIQSIQFVSQSGEDTRPEDGAEVYIISLSSSFKIAVASDDRVLPTAEKGEKQLYSLLGGVKQTFLNLLNTGIIEINGNVDNMIRYAALETAIDLFVDSINTAIGSAITGHTHGGVTPGTGFSAAGAGSANLVEADISLSKIEEVKTS